MASTVALAASLLVVGPWSGPARAETRNVGDAGAFVAAVEELKLLPGDHTIFLTADIDLTDVPMLNLVSEDPGVHITIESDESDRKLIICMADVGECESFMYVQLLGGSLTVRNVAIDGFAGGLYVEGTPLTVEHSRFSSNTRTVPGGTARGGAIVHLQTTPDQELVISDSYFYNNKAIGDDATGGAVYFEGMATITNTTFDANSAQGQYGEGLGGALAVHYSSGPTLDGVTFLENTVTGQTTAQGGAMYVGDSYMEVYDSTFDENRATFGEGAAMAVRNSTVYIGGGSFTDNRADSGGAIYGYFHASLVVWDSSFTDNRATIKGGALTIANASFADIYSSLFASNQAEDGGAIYSTDESSVDVEASTIAHNGASSRGAAVFLDDETYGFFKYVTIARNEAPEFDPGLGEGGQLFARGSGAEFHQSVIVEPDISVNCYLDASSFEGDAHNRADDETCFSNTGTDIAEAGFDAELGPLQFNGGPTLTMVPNQGSPLLNVIELGDEEELCGTWDGDQRGVDRGQEDACDLGAVEAIRPLEGWIETPGGEVWIRILNSGYTEYPVVSPISSFTPAAPAGVAYPYGGMELTIHVWDDGWPVDIEYFTPTPSTQLWKLYDGEWVEPPGLTSLAHNGGTLWFFRVTDGGWGDNDFTPNAEIIDPFAAGVAAAFTG